MKRVRIVNHNKIKGIVEWRSRIKCKFSIKQKGVEVVHEELWQWLVAVGAKLERHGSSTGRITYLYQTRRDYSTNWKEQKEKV